MSKYGYPIERVLKPRCFSPFDNGSGYKVVGLKNGRKTKNHYVHRLVAEAFLPNPDGRTEVNHLDYDKGNNTVENLEWATRTENVHWSRERMMHPTKGAKLTNLGMRYISMRYGKYRVNIRNERLGYQFDKCFETLEEAITAKEAFISGKEYYAV